MKNKEKYTTVRGYELQKRDNKQLTDSMEDYMEMIYRQCLEDNYTRINTLSKELNVKASSASKMVQKLTHLGLLNYEKYGIIRLTEKGKSVGEFLLYRHNTIKDFLMLLNTNMNLLSQTEALEHSIDFDTLKKIDLLIHFFQDDPELQKRLQDYLK
ncbi:metal-dependent transcriptional regulator [Serpentinicella alkaliphila]|uniref:Manganese transport regulator n=1 Tax=Serpentinicella alkaliphila TaxID=1734049 RepID=A0A4R2TPI5_9FIRM|nr:iron dependent repressor, metal binding and dimerization domain protein [Serpentinicella alkaliphila]QUH24535.1 winged helix DNA-binding protein [Serpentinicella alkaliphila]TCQ04627.1 DtxR family iron (metal) dependent repressor [Serpentinicella alkaliphila]